VVAVMYFVFLVASFYVPGKRWTAFLRLGDKASARYVPDLRSADVYFETDSYGYDAQQYVQLALHPDPTDPVLNEAVDNLPYRTRRMLFSWLSWLLGAADPGRILTVYSLINVASWLGLALLLLRWFPPDGLQNFIRWAGLLFSYGMWISVRSALVDGPSLLLIAGGVALAERRRFVWSAVVLGVSGLAKETNILAASIFFPPDGADKKAWGTMVLRGVLVLLPLAVWSGLVYHWLGGAGAAGARNFGLPFADFLAQWGRSATTWASAPEKISSWSDLFWMVGVSVQFLFLALRPEWKKLWWRVGAAFALLMIVLGESVWEGQPGAATRVLLPMALAFNVLVPRTRWWLLVLVLGNLTVFGLGESLLLPKYDSVIMSGTRELLRENGTDRKVSIDFSEGWYQVERSRQEYWRWTNGAAALTISNPHQQTLRADLSMDVRSFGEREVIVKSGEAILWRGNVGKVPVHIFIQGLRIRPGEVLLRLDSDKPSVVPSLEDPRPIAFNVRNLKLMLRALEP